MVGVNGTLLIGAELHHTLGFQPGDLCLEGPDLVGALLCLCFGVGFHVPH